MIDLVLVVVSGLHVAVIVVSVVLLSLLARASCSVLLSNSTFELVYSSFFELSAHDFFLPEPSVFLMTILI